MEIENLLPFDILYKLINKAGTVEFSGLLNKGNVSPIYNMNPEETVAISFSVIGTDLKSDVAIINAAGNDSVDEQIVCRDKTGAKLELLIAYEQVGEFGHASRVSFYSPYVILNKTDLSLLFCVNTFMGSKQPSAGQSDILAHALEGRPYVSKPILFSYPEFEVISNRACFKLADSPATEWSDPVSFEAVGSGSERSLMSQKLATQFLFSINIDQGVGKVLL